MTKNKSGLNFIVVLVVSVLVFSGSVSAIVGSIVGGKMTLSKELYPELWQLNGKDTVTIEKYITVKNKNDVSINITLDPDENATKFIELIDKSFILQPNQEKKANFYVKIKNPGIYTGQIAVLFKEVDGKNGIALPSSIVVIAKEAGSYEEDSSDENSDSQESGINAITGGVTGVADSSPGAGMIVLLVTSVLLVVILIFLVILVGKRKKTTKRNGNGKAEVKKK